MTVKKLKELIKYLSDETEVCINHQIGIIKADKVRLFSNLKEDSLGNPIKNESIVIS